MRLDALLGFERQGHCTVHKALAPQQLQAVIPAIDRVWTSQALAVHCQKVSVLLPSKEAAVVEAKAKQAPSATKRLEIYQRALEALPEGSAPFLQCFNLWRQSREVAALACSPELAGSAARLLGAERVRLYQDSLFVKRPGDGPTHWHSDLAMAPLDTNSFVTVWLPLQPVPPETEGGSALVFASGSHRDVALSFWHGSDADCSNRGYAEALAERSAHLFVLCRRRDPTRLETPHAAHGRCGLVRGMALRGQTWTRRTPPPASARMGRWGSAADQAGGVGEQHRQGEDGAPSGWSWDRAWTRWNRLSRKQKVAARHRGRGGGGVSGA
jgi:hypothetical protein